MAKIVPRIKVSREKKNPPNVVLDLNKSGLRIPSHGEKIFFSTLAMALNHRSPRSKYHNREVIHVGQTWDKQ